jgi:transcriptional regulator with XRE-family HTH domain
MALRDTLIANILRYMQRDAIANTNDLARRSGVPQPTLHRFMKGTHDSINLRHIERLAICFGTDPARLFTREMAHTTTRRTEELLAVMEQLPEPVQESLFQIGSTYINTQESKP